MARGHLDDERRELRRRGRRLVAELELRPLLAQVVEEARALTGAGFAAAGVLDDGRLELTEFIASGVDAATHRAIGRLPAGRGTLGRLLTEPTPIRSIDIARRADSYGFPPGHPVMRSFLGVGIVVRGTGWGNLYMAQKAGGAQFSERDAMVAAELAAWVAGWLEPTRPR